MDKRQKHMVQVFRRVRDFMGRNTMPPALSSADAHVEALEGAIERLTSYAVEQDARTRLTRVGTVSIGRQVRRLRQHYMAPIARFGLELPGLDVPTRAAMALPRSTDAEGTVASALGLADAADSRKAAFVSAGFAEDFTDRLRTAARALKASIDDRAKDRGRRSASTAGVRHELRVGRAAIRMLDAIVSPALESTPSLLAEWRTLKRQLRHAGSVGEPAPVVGPPAGGVSGGGTGGGEEVRAA